ncbi:MAG: transglutaminase-like cysteine peptidase [Syntrophales bacterium]
MPGYEAVAYVMGHTDGIRECRPDDVLAQLFYIFHNDGSGLKISSCTWEDSISVLETKSAAEAYTLDTDSPIKFHSKRFTHNVVTNGVPVARDLYFITTTLYISPSPAPAWGVFSAANPTWPLVSNNLNTQITMTGTARSDLNAVNKAVNDTHGYTGESGDVWRIMEEGETGDCEDFALTKAQRLLDMGYPASALHIEMGIKETDYTKAHAWLVVQTTEGDYALDISGDTIIRNGNLKQRWGGVDWVQRRRQIGAHWAFISPFGWMLSSYNSDSYCYYILDPLLNIFYYLGWSGSTLFYPQAMMSINFSDDNNIIYFQWDGVICHYRIVECGFTMTYAPDQHYIDGFVQSNGLLSLPYTNPYNGNSTTLWTKDVVSMDGYYDIIDYPKVSDLVTYSCEPPRDEWPTAEPWDVTYVETRIYDRTVATTPLTQFHTGGAATRHAWAHSFWDDGDDPISYDPEPAINVGIMYRPDVVTREPNGNPFYYQGHYNEYYPHSAPEVYVAPNGESFPYGQGQTYYYPMKWVDMKVGSLLIQGFLLVTWVGVAWQFPIKRLWTNSGSLLSQLALSVGVSEQNLLGIAYIPWTDRLNT